MLVDLHHTRINEPDTDRSHRLHAALIEDLVPGNSVAIVSQDNGVEGHSHLPVELGDPSVQAVVGSCVELRKC